MNKPSGISKFIKYIFSFREVGILIPLIIICVVTSIINPIFATGDNLINLLRSISVAMIGGVGMTFILISGGLDLSIGSVLALGGMVTGYFLGVAQFPVVISILLGISTSALAGFVNGFVTSRFGLPPLIVTLGMMNVARGVVNVMSKGRPYSEFPDVFNSIGQSSFLGIPLLAYIALVLVIAGHFVLKYTVFGRCITAIGGNEDTARVSGIDVVKYKLLNYVIMAVLSGIAGILIASRLSTSVANAGTGWELSIIASVVIGGTSMYGGSGSVIGTVIGVSIMEVLKVAITMLRIDPYWQSIVVGVIIVLAVGLDTYRRKLISGSGG